MKEFPTDVMPYVSAKSTNATLRAFGEEVVILLSGANTAGKLTMWVETTPPGGGPPPHYHENEDEWFFVLEGSAEFFLNGWTRVAPGGAVFVPKGTVHTFRNAGDSELKMLIQATPSGFETFFASCAEEFARSSTPDMERILAIGARHGIHFVS
ncbi:MAG: cupin domain-containing protein [Phycisphaeraceae bacterium]|nr:cupin domain-containing protein [Phycisphaeraceae bacterium]